MRPRAAALACAGLVVVAGCGGGDEPAEAPPLPAPLAHDLAARSDAVADRLEAGDACAARTEAEALQARTIAAVNDRRVPHRYQEQLLGSVTALVESIECVAQPAPEPSAGNDDEDVGDEGDDEDEEDDADRGKGKAKGKDKKKGRGKG